MIAEPQPLTKDTDHPTHRELVESFRQIVLEETDNGRRIIRSLVSIMEGEVPEGTPWHQLEAARLLRKLGYEPAGTFIRRMAVQRARSRSAQRAAQDETQSAITRIQTELAQIVHEETDSGRTTVRFLVQAMEGELEGFKPCHRLYAAKELVRCVFDFVPVEEDIDDEAEPLPDLGEEWRQRQRRRREEALEFSLHGPLHYDANPFPCPCEDRRHDCDGNELSEEEHAEAVTLAPIQEIYISDSDELDAFIERYKAYLNRINPGKPEVFNAIRWRRDNHDP